MPSAQHRRAVCTAVDALCDRFEDALQAGRRPTIESWLEEAGSSAREALVELVALELDYRVRAGESATAAEYLHRFPQLATDSSGALQLVAVEYLALKARELPANEAGFKRRYSELANLSEWSDGPWGLAPTVGRELISAEGDRPWSPGNTAEPDELIEGPRPVTSESQYTESLLSDTPPETDGDTKSLGAMQDWATLPNRFGRFKIERQLGRGAFGAVYLARDEGLNRLVAIKVPHPKQFASYEELESLMTEARTAAQLANPGIVTIHEVCRDNERAFIVQEYVDGQDLGKFLESQAPAPTFEISARLMVAIAEAVAFAHAKGFVHRDLKPANILIDTQQRPHVADFGLAVHETIQRRRRGEICGTPAYMSPEQVRGETHRLDGRSDIWSLGVILYEMLTGRRPFAGELRSEIFDEIQHRDPKPPRQICEQVPAELERICLKCLSRRITDRYSNAFDLASDLQQWLASSEQTIVTASASIQVVPKGLRSFDEGDAGFFLDLLPGPKDREGLPESIRFWKTRIEESDADRTFAVGLVYGPSGCGKSSLMKAGLLPRLASHVLPIYVEATAEDTELRVLKGLRKACPAISVEATLPDVFAALREGVWLPRGKKIVVVLDQFEQWLHARRADAGEALIQALRQCDGARLQGVIMVRDDFGMAAARFMDAVDVPILQGQNFATVDLFDVDHARKVLIKFGQAFGRLVGNHNELSDSEVAFINSVVTGLAQDGKVVSVRLAIFAEMVKGKPWVPSTLVEVGGTQGIGENFLEETFASRSRNPKHRLHESAARGVLKALLPEVEMDIRGHMRSYTELLNASGYERQPSDFEDLLRILDGQLRLITPTEENEKGQVRSANDEAATSSLSTLKIQSLQFYQLTHDYLVPSLRDWLTRKQRETRRGQAELRLSELASLWNSRFENRFLPSWWEYLNIQGLTNQLNWTEPQRKMMAKAGRIHVTRTVILAATLALGIFGSRELNGRFQARAAVERLTGADVDVLRPALEQVNLYRAWADPALRTLASATAGTAEERRSQFHARLALVWRDASQVELVLQELLTNHVSYVGVIRDQLAPYKEQFETKLWETLHDIGTDPTHRFRAGLALAAYAPQSNQWTPADATFISEQLVVTNAEHQPRLREYLRPIQDRLLTDLERIFADRTVSEGRQLSAVNALADFAAKDPLRLARLLTLATPDQYAVLYPLMTEAISAAASDSLVQLIRQHPAEDMPQADRVTLGQRRAGAAITLLRQGQREQIVDALRVGSDPESLSQFVARCRSRGVTVSELLECVDRVDASRKVLLGAARKVEDRALYGLLLALGEFQLADIAPVDRQPLVDRLINWYSQDPRSGIHGATGWLLRQWGFQLEASRVDQTPIPYDATGEREWYTLEIKSPSEGTRVGLDPIEQSLYFTFIVFPAGQYRLGSPDGEADEQLDERLRQVVLTRPFAVCDRELTWAQFDPIDNRRKHIAWEHQFERKLGDHDPAFGINWFEAVSYCRWLTTQSQFDEKSQCYDDPGMLTTDQEGNPLYERIYLDRTGFRLPTEAEWEVACQGGMQSTFSFGNDIQLLRQYGWSGETSNKWSHTVGQLRPNPRGLFDVHGNLTEWCHDWYGTKSESELVVDPSGPSKGPVRVVRGGGFVLVPEFCRTALRKGNVPSARLNYQGFRVAVIPGSSANLVRLPRGAASTKNSNRK